MSFTYGLSVNSFVFILFLFLFLFCFCFFVTARLLILLAIFETYSTIPEDKFGCLESSRPGARLANFNDRKLLSQRDKCRCWGRDG